MTTDTILWSDLFMHVSKCKDMVTIDNVVNEMKIDFSSCLKRSMSQVIRILDELPKEWNVPRGAVEEKMRQLFDKHWSLSVWENFIECLNENMRNG
mgnify:CR=1 FL=1